MKKITILAITFMTLLASSCSKEQTTVHAIVDITSQADGKEDTDGPIIMEITRHINCDPVANAYVIFTNNQDTLSGYTDSAGRYTVRLTRTGTWNIAVSHALYSPVITTMNIECDTVRIDTLL